MPNSITLDTLNFYFIPNPSRGSIDEHLESSIEKTPFSYKTLCTPTQVHSSTVIWADKPGRYDKCDGIITNTSNNLVLTLSTADCIPVALSDNRTGNFSLVHAGWRGVVGKVINKSIITDDVPLELPKDPDNSTVYKLYKLIASADQSKQMANKLKAGGYGWGHAKKELSDLIIEKYKSPRDKFNYFMSNLNELDEILKEGSIKAKEVAQITLKRLKEKIGY